MCGPHSVSTGSHPYSHVSTNSKDALRTEATETSPMDGVDDRLERFHSLPVMLLSGPSGLVNHLSRCLLNDATSSDHYIASNRRIISEKRI